MILDGIDEALQGTTRAQRRRERRRRTRIGWRQVIAQVLYVLAITAFVLALLSHSDGW
ncbi:hypothetical protein [Streptomyces caeruleatus]|uniref:hypothetical protein n=1 Tax=Streptomyces caeruleatus TaxID=661399 RepID=UPI000A75B74E|nr:hypothetical protein [Streptomyces caeruleatus]